VKSEKEFVTLGVVVAVFVVSVVVGVLQVFV
jgi:hypothetical protein